MEIFRLFGSVLVDSSEAQKSISKTGEEAEGLGQKLAKGIGTAAKWGAAIGAAATAVGGAIVAASKEMASSMDVVDKASARMKIGAESYQELAHAANLSGVEMGTLEKAAKKLEGTDLNLDDAMAQIYELGTAEERSAKAAELFGEAVAYQMTPMLNASAEEMDAMKQEAHDLGLVMSEDTVKAGASLNDMFAKVEGSVGALKNNLLTQFMPYVMEILQWVLDNMPMIQETVASVMDAVWPIVKTVLDLIMQALPPLLEAVKSLIDWIMPYLKPVLDSLTGLIQGIFALFKGDTDTFIESIKGLLTSFADAIFGIGGDIMNSLWDGIKGVWENISNWVSEKITWLSDKLQFWKSGNDSMEVDGSHAAGLNYVPYDGYIAELHKGETVLNASSTANLSSDIVNGIRDAIGNMRGGQPIELTLNIDGAEFARATYDANQAEMIRRGTNYVMG